MSNRDILMAKLVKRGLPQYIAAAWVANFDDESGLNPGINERNPVVKGSRGGFGFAQWTGPRRVAYEKYAVENGRALDDGDAQLDFLFHEGATTEKKAWAAIMAAPDAQTAALLIHDKFLRAGISHSASSQKKAAEWANQVFDPELASQSIGAGRMMTPLQAAAGASLGAKAERISLMQPEENYTGADMAKAAETPLASYRSVEDDKAIEREREAATPGLVEGLKLAVSEQWIGASVVRQMGGEVNPYDKDFRYTPELWDELSKDLPDAYRPELAKATSEQNARDIATRTRESVERDQKLGSMGWTGVGLQFGAAIADPVSILASAATEGAAAPVIYGAKIGRMARFLRGGAVAAATNTALDSYMISQDPVAEWDQLAYSAVAGFALGGAAGALRGSTPMDQDLARVAKKQVQEWDRGGASGSTAGAKQVEGTEKVELPSKSEAVYRNSVGAAEAKRPLGLPRIDLTGQLMSSPNPVMRKAAQLIGEDAVGDRNAVSVIAADEQIARELRLTETRFAKVHTAQFKKWVEDEGIGEWARLSDPAVRHEFNNQVGRAVRRVRGTEEIPPTVARAADAMREEMAYLHKFGQEKGIAGFENFGPSDTYLSRQYRIGALDNMTAEIGEGNVKNLIANSFLSGDRKWRNANPQQASKFNELEYEDALNMASALYKGIMGRRYKAFDIEQALNGDRTDTLEELLKEADMSAEEVANLLRRMDEISPNKEARIGNAKRRLRLDETYSMKAGDGREYGVEDLLENDVEQIFNGYSQSVIREGFLGDVRRAFSLPDAEGNLPKHGPSFTTIKQYIADAETHGGNPRPKAQVEEEIGKLEHLYNNVRGIPNEAPKAWHQGARRLRDYNFLRVMGQVGVAQVAEFGQILGNGGVRTFMDNLPAFRGIINKARTGRLSDEAQDEIEAIWGAGTDIYRHSPSLLMDDNRTWGIYENRGASGWQKFDYGMNQLKYATSVASGMQDINRILQRFNARVLVQRMVDHAHTGSKISRRRLNALGVSADMEERIAAQLRAHTKTQKSAFSKRRLRKMDLDKWTDQDAKSAFITAVDRWSRKVIQENNPGNMPAWMSTEVGKVVGQFRTFMIAAYTKQLMAGLEQRDWVFFSSFMGSMFFGALAYVGQQYVNSAGRADRQEWLDKRLEPMAIAKAGFQRAGASTFIPGIVDTAAAPFNNMEPIFGYRTTELSAGVMGNPTLDLLDTLVQATQGATAAAFDDNYDFSQTDFRKVSSLAPWQNAFGVRNGLAAISGNLPKYSQ